MTVTLPNGAEVDVEVLAAGGTANISVPDRLVSQEVQRIVEGLAKVIGHALQRLRPQKATGRASRFDPQCGGGQC